MHIRFRWRDALLGVSLLALGACSDEIPTVVDGSFPPGQGVSTLEAVIGADALVSDVSTFGGYTGPRDATFALVANGFGGVLEAHSLLRFSGAPETDSVAAFGGATLTLRVDTARSLAAGTDLQLWVLEQEWSETAVSWERATDTTLWRENGGTRGALLGSVSAVAVGDSVVFTLGADAARRVAQNAASPGLLVTAAGEPGRVRINGAALSLTARLQSAPDSTVTRLLTPQTFAFVATPDQPAPATALAAGGVGSARTLFRLRLPERLPSCDPLGPQDARCGTVPLGDVTINSASLLLVPVAVPDGYRPLGPVPLTLRTVLDPELGRNAPLGPIALDQLRTASGAVFYTGANLRAGDSVAAIPVTQLVRNLAANDSVDSVNLALLGANPNQPLEPVATFGPAWFAPSPRLRIVYTVPPRPALP